MKKAALLLLAFALAGGAAASLYWAWKQTRTLLAPRSADLRAFQRDEDAPPRPEPELDLTVNGASDAAIAAGGPLFLTVAVAHRHAANAETKIRALRERASRLEKRGNLTPVDRQALEKTKAAIESHRSVALLRLGENWPNALQVTLRNLAGGEAAAWTLKPLGRAAPRAAVLDGDTSAAVHLAPAGAPPAAGNYAVRVCLAATGEWKGKACSAPVRLAVRAAEADLSAGERDRVERVALRLAWLTENLDELERRGAALLKKRPKAAHVALGDAAFGRQQWDKALEHYTAARSAFRRPLTEPPRDLNLRITRLLEILEEAP